MLLHLPAPAAGARLAVCDTHCARHACLALTVPVAAVTDDRAAPRGCCLRCVACGGLIDDPITEPCLWHPLGCPSWEHTHTIAAAVVTHRLAGHDDVVLGDAAMLLLGQTLAQLTEPTGLPDAEATYTFLRSWLLRPPP